MPSTGWLLGTQVERDFPSGWVNTHNATTEATNTSAYFTPTPASANVEVLLALGGYGAQQAIGQSRPVDKVRVRALWRQNEGGNGYWESPRIELRTSSRLIGVEDVPLTSTTTENEVEFTGVTWEDLATLEVNLIAPRTSNSVPNTVYATRVYNTYIDVEYSLNEVFAADGTVDISTTVFGSVSSLAREAFGTINLAIDMSLADASQRMVASGAVWSETSVSGDAFVVTGPSGGVAITSTTSGRVTARRVASGTRRNLTTSVRGAATVILQGTNDAWGAHRTGAVNGRILGGTPYVLSFDYRSNNITELDYIHLVDRVAGNQGLPHATGLIADGNWRRVEHQFVLGRDSSTTPNDIIFGTTARGPGSFSVRAPKLERGHRATDWTPATEDVDAAVGEVKTAVDEVQGTISEVQDIASNAALIAASATGFDIWPNSAPLPTTRRSGAPLVRGDGLYLIDLQDNITGVRIWSGTAWVSYSFAADHILATQSIIGDLIAANTEIIAPVITGGVITGVTLRTVVDNAQRHVLIRDDDIVGYGLNSVKGFELGLSGFTPHLSMWDWDYDSGAPRSVYLAPQTFTMSNRDGASRFDVSVLSGSSVVTNRGNFTNHGNVDVQSGTLRVYGAVYGGASGSARLDTVPGTLSTLSSSVDTRFSVVNSTATYNYNDLNTKIADRALVGTFRSLTPNSGWSSSSFGYVQTGQTIQLSGLITRASGSLPTNYTAFDTIPAIARPSRWKYFSITGYDPLSPGMVALSPAGVLQVRAAGGQGFSLDDISYSLD